MSRENSLRLLKLIDKKDLTIAQLSSKLKVSRTVVYYHVNKLRKMGLIKEYKTSGKGSPHFVGKKDGKI